MAGPLLEVTAAQTRLADHDCQFCASTFAKNFAVQDYTNAKSRQIHNPKGRVNNRSDGTAQLPSLFLDTSNKTMFRAVFKTIQRASGPVDFQCDYGACGKIFSKNEVNVKIAHNKYNCSSVDN